MTRATFEQVAMRFAGIDEQHGRIASALGCARAVQTLISYRERGVPGVSREQIDEFIDEIVGLIVRELEPTGRNLACEDVMTEADREHCRIMQEFEYRFEGHGPALSELRPARSPYAD